MLCLICKSRCPVAVTWTVNVGLCTTVCLRSMPIVRVALLALHLETKWPARMYCSRYGLCARRCCSRYEFFAELCLQLYDICLHTPPHPPPPAPADHGMMVVNSNLKGAAADHGMMMVMAIFFKDVSADSVDDSYMHTLRSSTDGSGNRMCSILLTHSFVPKPSHKKELLDKSLIEFKTKAFNLARDAKRP